VKIRLHGARRRGFLAGSAAITAIGIIRTRAKAAQFELRCASNFALDHPTSVRLKQMWVAVERESGGRVRAQFFPNSLLGGDAAMLSQLRLGALHFLLDLPNLSAVVPTVDILNVGFAFKDQDAALRGLDGPLGEYIRKELNAKGLYPQRNLWASGMRDLISSSRPIRTADDLSGIKVRVAASKIATDFFKTLGASPVSISFSEAYTALQTRLIDGADAPLSTMDAARFYEVQKYLSLTNHSFAGVALLANGDLWKSLPLDLQGIIERNNTKYTLLERHDSNLRNAAVAEKFSRVGLAVNKVDSTTFRARLRSYYETWANEFGPTAWALLQSASSGKLG
jgi:TRAP-type transport system periplasmic protein